MKLAGISFYRYALPFKYPLDLSKTSIEQREGVIIKLTSEAGVSAFGEAAPLDGFSAETIDEVIDRLPALDSWLRHHEVPDGIEKLKGKLFVWLEPLGLPASLGFAVEMACLNLVANSRRRPLSRLISDHTRDRVRVNGLLVGSRDEVAAQARALLDAGFCAMKLKVGGDIKEDAGRVRAVNAVIEGRAILRLDANQGWSVEDAIAFGNDIGCAAVDYIEEPFRESGEIPRFFNETFIPAALDETVLTTPFERIKSIEGVDVLVLKPTLLGGIEKTWKLIEAARAQAIVPIVSSAFESSLGVLTLANIAGGSAVRDTGFGLDTMKWFKKDLLKEPVVLENGTIDISRRRVEDADINYDCLTPIAL
jgi:o-succinylbenzoate synthase